MDKITIDSISEHPKGTQIVSNLARQKTLVTTVYSIIRTRYVVLSELSVNLNNHVKTDSN
jgi:hypothetical protein